MPRDFESAERLAEKDKYQFQWWANYLFNPHAIREQKKGPDRGIDGELFFPNGPGRSWGRMLTSVKGGESLNPDMVRAFAQVLTREKAEMGLFICLHKPTRGMEREASAVGIADTVHGDLPRLQIVSIEEWFQGRTPRLPPLEHLPSAAISRIGRRRRQAGPRPDVTQSELPLPFTGNQSANMVRHFNRQMIDEVAIMRRARQATPNTERLRREPELPPMPIRGGRATRRQEPLPLEGPLLSSPQPSRRRRSRS